MTMTKQTIAVIGAVLVLAVAAIAQTRTDVHPGKVQIRSTASDALTVLGGADISGYTIVRGNQPALDFREADAGTDEKFWGFTSGAGDLFFRSIDDAYSVGTNVYTIGRTGATPGPFTFAVPVAVGTGGGSASFSGIVTGTATWDPNNLGTDEFDSVLVTVTGVASSSPCFASFTSALNTNVVLHARYDTTNTVRVIVQQVGTGPFDASSGTARATCFVY